MVERDEFVRLWSRQPGAPAEQFLQAFPLRPVLGDEDIEVHGAELVRWSRSDGRL